MREAMRRLDEVMAELIQADQTGEGMEPLRLAQELGRIRAMLLEAPAVLPRGDGQRHFRCENCGTITHGDAMPTRCPTCGGAKFFKADMEMPIVDAGPA